jgi:hypothetical protein
MARPPELGSGQDATHSRSEKLRARNVRQICKHGFVIVAGGPAEKWALGR